MDLRRVIETLCLMVVFKVTHPQDDCTDKLHPIFCDIYRTEGRCGDPLWREYVNENCPEACGLCKGWTAWSSWSGCTSTCGISSRRRFRSCRSGISCKGESSEVTPCIRGGCPPTWSSWLPCSRSCGLGFRTRTKICAFGSCQVWPTVLDYAFCYMETCNVEGTKAPSVHSNTWLTWSDWGACDATCGNSSRRRTRSCRAQSCVGSDFQEANCSFVTCAVTGDCPSPPFSAELVVSPSKAIYLNGDVVTYNCAAVGHVIQGQNQSVCLNGVWSSVGNSVATCLAKKLKPCNKLRLPAGMELILIPRDPFLGHGKELKVRCPKINRNIVATCINGKWLPRKCPLR